MALNVPSRVVHDLGLATWVIPAITGGLIVVSAFAGEQQRPTSVKAGVLDRLKPLS